MELSVLGIGYVGLVTAGCFAEMGNHVTCVDIDRDKIEGLKQGRVPIHEPGLDDIVRRNIKTGRLRFTTDMSAAVDKARVHFIAVGTPPGEDGSADLQHVLKVAEDLASHLSDGRHLVVDKSTVPVGTAARVAGIIQQCLSRRDNKVCIDVVSNPEFLKEGSAVSDFMRPSRVIIGTDSDVAAELLQELYAPFTRNHGRSLVMGVRDAEMCKYAANAMLATKISFMNEIASICEELAVDVENVRIGIGSDERIGYHFIYPGCGYGGSCFPKDVKALINMAQQQQLQPSLLQAVEWRNQQQKRRLFEKIENYYQGDLRGLRFALWGLAFKPGTDDVREAPALDLIAQLIEAGAMVDAHDPVAMESAAEALPDEWLEQGLLSFQTEAYETLYASDALIVTTEWKEYRSPDFDIIGELLNQPVIFDGRNIYDPGQLSEQGFDYIGIGRHAMARVEAQGVKRQIA